MQQADSRPTAHTVVDGIDLTGKTAVITGASSGLGRESARALASAGAHVVLCGRDRSATLQAQERVCRSVPNARTSVAELDLASLASVRVTASAIAELTPVVHILMNNAGVMFTPFGRTKDGFELQFGTNHLGHFAFAKLLHGQLIAANGARIVNLASDGYRLGDIDLDDPNWHARAYDKFAAYGAAKTANILHAVELDRRLSDRGVRAYAVHPGMVATRLARHMTADDVTVMTSVGNTKNLDVLTPEQGAATQVWAAVS
ncbi:SDR family NAD(P)-dependent oxidoreductase, partial [Aldersonia kunmingensis]|uniref:SDR family NAD(P)-dependent oxidoreductase n=1 Tax=Aldersonia kunmingensis TaxID=408066 RepID=UPI000830C20D